MPYNIPYRPASGTGSYAAARDQTSTSQTASSPPAANGNPQQVYCAIDSVPIRTKLAGAPAADPHSRRPPAAAAGGGGPGPLLRGSGSTAAPPVLLADGLPPSRQPVPPRQPPQSGLTSVNSSFTSQDTSIFDNDPDTLPSTQTTSADELCDNSDDDFPATASDIEALDVSFSLSQEIQSSPSQGGPSLRLTTSTSDSHSAPTTVRRIPSEPVSPDSDDETWFSAAESDSDGRDETDDLASYSQPLTSSPSFLAIEDRLDLSWPECPEPLKSAPFAVIWEITRATLHCAVDLAQLDLTYDPKWTDQHELWAALGSHPAFQNKILPPKAKAAAWKDSIAGIFQNARQSIIFAASATFRNESTGPLMKLQLQPPKYDKSCRLYRRFGSDRFLELNMPSLEGRNCRHFRNEMTLIKTIQWLSSGRHNLAGRTWVAFFTRDCGFRTPRREVDMSPEKKTIHMEKVHFFAEKCGSFTPTQPNSSFVSSQDLSYKRPEISREEMLDWLLQFEDNRNQPALKLFSRITLGLSKSQPLTTIVLEDHQVRHQAGDYPLRTDLVMNDGIARISPALMKKVRVALDLDVSPAAFQGRFGSAKGMWLVDQTDTSGEEWIETFDSQRKWNCDWDDPYHRTIEIKSCSNPPRPAFLNTQFLLILWDRAIDKSKLKETLKARTLAQLEEKLNLRQALEHPASFLKWAFDNSSMFTRDQGAGNGLDFLGGLPNSSMDTLKLFVLSGFDPRKLKYLRDIVYNMQVEACNKLHLKMNIKLTQSTYVFMVVDFSELLEPDEVHLGFSTPFDDGSDDLGGIMYLDQQEILVGRCPAHFPSDVQKVKAVYKRELGRVQNVIFFSTKGTKPLADMLSGGDYDGDKAWVCWDSEIVDNFENAADPPPMPDLSDYMTEDKTTLQDIIDHRGKAQRIDRLIHRGFDFSLSPSLLGRVTTFKDKLTYLRNNINDHPAHALSWLLREIADQTKRGIVFGTSGWKQLVKDHCEGPSLDLPDPAYKDMGNFSWRNKDHILDYLKFDVFKPAIDAELDALKHILPNSTKSGLAADEIAQDYDRDLAILCDELDGQTKSWDPDDPPEERDALAALQRDLKNDIDACAALWSRVMNYSGDDKVGSGGGGGGGGDFCDKVWQVYDQWAAIRPRDETYKRLVEKGLPPVLQQGYLRGEYRGWELLKASMTFKLYCRRNAKFVWRVAGRQLFFIKAMNGGVRWGRVGEDEVGRRTKRSKIGALEGGGEEEAGGRYGGVGGGGGCGAMLVREELLSLLKVDGRGVKQQKAKWEGERSLLYEDEESQDDVLGGYGDVDDC